MDYKNFTDDFADKIDPSLFSGLLQILTLTKNNKDSKILIIGEHHNNKVKDSKYPTITNVKNLEKFIRYVTKEKGMRVFFEGKEETPAKDFSLPNFYDLTKSVVERVEYKSGGFGILASLNKIHDKNPDLDFLINVDDRKAFSVLHFKNTLFDKVDWRFEYAIVNRHGHRWAHNLNCFLTIKDFYVVLNHMLSLFYGIFQSPLNLGYIFSNPFFSEKNLFLWKFKFNWPHILNIYRKDPFIKKLLHLLDKHFKLEQILRDPQKNNRSEQIKFKNGNYKEKVLYPLVNAVTEIIDYLDSFSDFLNLAVKTSKNNKEPNTIRSEYEMFDAMYKFYNSLGTRRRKRYIDDEEEEKLKIIKTIEQSKLLVNDSENLIMTKLFPVFFNDYTLFVNGNYEKDPKLVADFIPNIIPDCSKFACDTMLLHSENFEGQVAKFFLENDEDCIFIAGQAHTEVLGEMLTGSIIPHYMPDTGLILEAIFTFTKDKKFLSLLFNSFETIETEDAVLFDKDDNKFGVRHPKVRNKSKRNSIGNSDEFRLSSEYQIIDPKVNSRKRNTNLASIIRENIAAKNEKKNIFAPFNLSRYTGVKPFTSSINKQKGTEEERQKAQRAEELDRKRMIGATKEYFHKYTSKLYDDIENDYSEQDYLDLTNNSNLLTNFLRGLVKNFFTIYEKMYENTEKNFEETEKFFEEFHKDS